jgi:hypothetical protein
MKPKAYKHKPMKIHEINTKPLVVYRKEKAYDYMKYFRVIRMWVKKNYNLNIYNFECLLFLYSEHIFSRKTFEKYYGTTGFEQSTLDLMIKQGWIVEFRKAYKTTAPLYELSAKAKMLIGRVYRFLNFEERITDYLTPELYRNKNASKYSERTLQRGINMLQDEFKERQLRLAQE